MAWVVATWLTLTTGDKIRIQNTVEFNIKNQTPSMIGLEVTDFSNFLYGAKAEAALKWPVVEKWVP